MPHLDLVRENLLVPCLDLAKQVLLPRVAASAGPVSGGRLPLPLGVGRGRGPGGWGWVGGNGTGVLARPVAEGGCDGIIFDPLALSLGAKCF